MLPLSSPFCLSIRADEPNANTEALAAVRGSVEHHRVGALAKLFENRLRPFASRGWGVEVSAFGVSIAVKNAGNGSAFTTGTQHLLVLGCYEMKSSHHDLSFAFRLTSSDRMKGMSCLCGLQGVSLMVASPRSGEVLPSWRGCRGR